MEFMGKILTEKWSILDLKGYKFQSFFFDLIQDLDNEYSSRETVKNFYCHVFYERLYCPSWKGRSFSECDFYNPFKSDYLDSLQESNLNLSLEVNSSSKQYLWFTPGLLWFVQRRMDLPPNSLGYDNVSINDLFFNRINSDISSLKLSLKDYDSFVFPSNKNKLASFLSQLLIDSGFSQLKKTSKAIVFFKDNLKFSKRVFLHIDTHAFFSQHSVYASLGYLDLDSIQDFNQHTYATNSFDLSILYPCWNHVCKFNIVKFESNGNVHRMTLNYIDTDRANYALRMMCLGLIDFFELTNYFFSCINSE